MIFTRKFLWTLSTLAILSYQSAHAMDTFDGEETTERSPSSPQKKKTTDEKTELIDEAIRLFRVFLKERRGIMAEILEDVVKEKRRFFEEQISELEEDGMNPAEYLTAIESFFKNYISSSKYAKHLYATVEDRRKQGFDALSYYGSIGEILDEVEEIEKVMLLRPTNEFISMLFLEKIMNASRTLEDFESFKKNATLISTEWGDLITKNEEKFLLIQKEIFSPQREARIALEQKIDKLNEELYKEQYQKLRQLQYDFEKQNSEINFSLIESFINKLRELKETLENETARALYEKLKTCKREYTHVDEDAIVLLLKDEAPSEEPVELMEEAEHKKISPKLKYLLERGMPQTIIFLGSIQDMIGKSNKINNICSIISKLNLQNLKKIVFKITSQEELYLAVKDMSNFYNEVTDFYDKMANFLVGQSNKEQEEAIGSLVEISMLNDTQNISDLIYTLDEIIPLAKECEIITPPEVHENRIYKLKKKAKKTFKNFEGLRIQITIPGKTLEDFIIIDEERPSIARLLAQHYFGPLVEPQHYLRPLFELQHYVGLLAEPDCTVM